MGRAAAAAAQRAISVKKPVLALATMRGWRPGQGTRLRATHQPRAGLYRRHLDEELTVDALSEVANFSKFHFHRQFSQHCGISLARYIQFMRLKRASYRLAFNPTAPIIDIALDSGFENPNPSLAPSNPHSARRPARSARRRTGRHGSARSRSLPSSERTNDIDVKIIDVEPIVVAALEHRGAPALNDTVQRFIAWRKTPGLSRSSQPMRDLWRAL